LSNKRSKKDTRRSLIELFELVRQLVRQGVDPNLILAVVFLALAGASSSSISQLEVDDSSDDGSGSE
jgi:hypothetical protein